MDLARLQTNWTNLGQRDPLWAILGSSQSKEIAWDLDAFLLTGEQFCGYLERHLQALGAQVQLGRALDFGCGYGRLSQALAKRFQEVVGVDIAPTMINGAREIDRSGGKCRFVLNDRADLGQFADASFDFVMTTLVLQHMRGDYALAYIAEFLRILRPGGVAFFQTAQRPRDADSTPPGKTRPADVPLDLARMRGSIAVHPGCLAVVLAEWQHFVVELHNRGDQVWLAGGGPHKVQVATRWHATDGVVAEPALLHDLPVDLAPGQTLRMLVAVRAPADALQAVLTFQVVVGGAWIELFALPPARALVQIVACDPELLRRNLALPSPPPFEPPGVAPAQGRADEAHIEIHGVPIAQVVATVRGNGGVVLDVTEDAWAGPSWLSAHYTVRKE